MQKFTALITCQTLTVLANDLEEAEKKYSEFFESERCPECECANCEHFELTYEVSHFWENEISNCTPAAFHDSPE